MRGFSGQPLLPDAPKFDLEAYVKSYKGRTRYARLYLMGSHSSFLSTEACKCAVAEAKQGKDIARYDNACRLLRYYEPNDPDATPDQAWLDKTTMQVKAETDRLEHELKGYKNNLIKESIRMGHEDFGNFYYNTGDLASSYKSYAKMREYCTSQKQILEMCLKMLVVGVEQANWIGVQTSILKMRDLTLKPELDAETRPKLCASMGLSYMASGNYREAASNFLLTDPSLGESFNQVMTSNDVAVYGGLCALASMDRDELLAKVLGNSSFRNFLELEPHIRRAISFFCNLKYSQCLGILEAYKTDYLLDINLRGHVQSIYQQIRTKSIVQYFIPFSDAKIANMAEVFGTDVDSMQEELVTLIQGGLLEARIDTQKKLLNRHVRNRRAEMIDEALAMATQYEKEARHRLIHINMINAGLIIKPQPSSNQTTYGTAGDIFSSGQAQNKGFRANRLGYSEKILEQ